MLLSKWEKGAFWCAGLSLIFFTHGNFWAAYWASKWWLLTAILAVIASFGVAKKSSLCFFPLILTVTLSGLYLSVWPEGPYLASSDYATVVTIGRNALKAVLILWTLIGVIGYTTSRLTSTVEKWLATLSLLSIGYTFEQAYFVPPPLRIAFSGNASMNGSLIAFLYPFVCKCLPQPLPFVLTLTSILLTHTSVPLGVFAVTWIFTIHKTFRPAAVVALLGCFAFCTQLPDLFDSSGRFPVWYAAMGYWWKECDVWFGAGLGSGQVLFPYIQKTVMSAKDHWFLWLHNDWLQTLFELGFVGFGSMLLAWCYLVVRAAKQPRLLASLMGFSACAMFNYPLHLPLHALCLTLIIWLVLQQERGI